MLSMTVGQMRDLRRNLAVARVVAGWAAPNHRWLPWQVAWATVPTLLANAAGGDGVDNC